MTKLKKLAVLFTVVLGMSQIANAQGPDGTRFGIKGGLNLSNLYTEDVDDQNVLLGFNLGVFVELPITSRISLQPEFLYTTKGAELKYNNAFIQTISKCRYY